MEPTDLESLIRRRRTANLASIVLGVGPTTYLLGLILGLPHEKMWLLLGMQVLVALVPYRLVLALPLQRRLMRQTLEQLPGEPPGHRLARILELPQRLHLLHLGLLTLIQGVTSVGYCLYFSGNPWRALPCFAVQELLTAFMLLVHLNQVEQALQPYVVEELHRAPTARIPRRALMWRRLSWQIPYTLGLTLACALVVPGIIVWRRGSDAVDALARELDSYGVPHAAELLQRQLEWLRGESAPVLGLGLFIGGLGVLFSWEIARRIGQGTRHLQRSLERAAAGTYQPPRWFSTDEVGRLTTATTRALLRLRLQARRLRGSAWQLGHSARELGTLQTQQLAALKRQMAALERARIQAQALQRESETSAREAQALLGLASQAEATHQSGRTALQLGIDTLSELDAEAGRLALRLHSLQRGAGRLSRLTDLVGDLANQSRLVALNASIEVANAGVVGSDFSRVASQARALAEHSLRSTHQVQTHLQSMLGALHEAVSTTREGAVDAANGVKQVHTSGDALWQLALAAEESAKAMRQIVQVLGRQNADISRLSHAVSHLSHAADETLRKLETATGVTRRVEEVSRRVLATVSEKEQAEDDGSRTPGGLDVPGLLRALLLEQQLTLWLWLVPGAYLARSVLGLEAEAARGLAWTVVAPLCVVGGVLMPLWMGRRCVAWALNPPAGTSPEQRLRRVLELPRRLGVIQTLTLAGLGLAASLVCGMGSGRGLPTLLACAVLLLLLAGLASVPPMLRLEDRIRPLAVTLFQNHPEVELPWRWPFWRSLSWYLPYVMGLTAFCVLAALTVPLWRLGNEAARRLVEELTLQGWLLQLVVYPKLRMLGVELAWALILPGTLLLLHAYRIARAVGQQMARGTRELEASLASIADGTPRLPQWVSTDELGSLSLAMIAIFHQLWTLAREVEEANSQLDEASLELEATQQQQAQGLARQSDLVNEALATVSEVEQASTMAAHRAAKVLATAERGQHIRRAGEDALAQALLGLADLGKHVTNIAERLGTLEEHARQIGDITTLLRGLARECDTVALNASIQAVRAGERGLVFVVIARELRALAERSSRTTRRAEPLLQEFTQSAREMVGVMRERAAGLGVGLEQANHSAEELRQLSGLVEEYRTAAGRIAEAIREQNLDIAEVSREMARVAETAEGLTKELEVSARLTATVGRMEKQ